MFGFGSTKQSAGIYTFAMVISLKSDPRNGVHDIQGEFELGSRETIEEAKEAIIAQYLKENGIANRGVFVVSFDYSEK